MVFTKNDQKQVEASSTYMLRDLILRATSVIESSFLRGNDDAEWFYLVRDAGRKELRRRLFCK